jgi:hypothetical protein
MRQSILFNIFFFVFIGFTHYAWSSTPCESDLVGLISPKNGSYYVLDKKTPEEEIVFSWANSGAAAYELVLSKNQDLSNPILTKIVEDTSVLFTHVQLQELIFDSAPFNGVNKYYNNNFYWTVRVGGLDVSIDSYVFSMSGMKIFKDIRGDEMVIYDVSIIPNREDGTSSVWLSQNLRTGKDISGNDLPYNLYSDLNDTGKVMLATPDYPEKLKSIAGYYYRQGGIVELKKLLVPPGWKYPTWTDFNQLYKASKQSFDMSMLRHPDAYPSRANSSFNEWNMNMAGFGRGMYNWGLTGCSIDQFYMSYSYDTTEPDNPDSTGSIYHAFSCNQFDIHNSVVQVAVPVRLIYIGDSQPDVEPIRESLEYSSVPVYNYVGSTFYVDSENGNDNNDGRSDTSAWQTLGKVNSVNFAAGSVVRFKCGGLWRGQFRPNGSGDSINQIVFTSYGTGEKPIIQNSVARNNLGDWVETSAGSGIWQANSDTILDIGNLIFDHGVAWGTKKDSLEKLKTELDFYKEVTSNRVFMRCDGNPANKFSSIELAITHDCVNFSARNYLVFDGFTVRYGGRHGFCGYNAKNIIIRRCDICWIGGGYQEHEGNQTTRLGNGVEFWIGAENSLVENNRIWEIYDAALTNQGGGTIIQKNITYRNNIIWNSEFSFEIWNRDSDAIMENILFENNTCVDAGKCWAHDQRPDPNGTHVLSYSNRATTSTVVIRNNIFSNSANQCVRMDLDWRSFGLVQDNNLYFTYPNGKIMMWLGDNNFYSFEKYQQELELDKHSVFTNPSFANPHIRDYRLSTGSPDFIRGMGVQQW